MIAEIRPGKLHKLRRKRSTVQQAGCSAPGGDRALKLVKVRHCDIKDKKMPQFFRLRPKLKESVLTSSVVHPAGYLRIGQLKTAYRSCRAAKDGAGHLIYLKDPHFKRITKAQGAFAVDQQFAGLS